MNATAYIRVSHRSQDLALQRAAIEKTAEARGDTVTRWFAEKRSGKTIDREELSRLRSELRAGRLAGQRLYVFRLDRLTRSGVRDTLEVVEEIRSSRVELVSVSDGFDLNGPAAEVILSVMAWAAKMELLARNERVAAARDRLESEGRAWGRPSRLTAPQRERIKVMRKAGKSLRQVAVALKIPRSTVARAAKLASQKGEARNRISRPSAGRS
jgi:DNA invertase Pin-like site-specific DNA recombinase